MTRLSIVVASLLAGACSGGSGGSAESGGATGTATGSQGTGSGDTTGDVSGSDASGPTGRPDVGTTGEGADLPPGWGDACDGHRQTHVGDVNAGVDADLAGLSGVTCIEGSLLLHDAVGDLSPLASLEVVGGDLRIHSTNLVGLQGLGALVRVTGSLSIGTLVPGFPCAGNPELVDLAGLSALSEVGADILVCNDPALISLAGLGTLLTGDFAGSIDLAALPALTSLAGLENLQSVGGALRITEDDGLANLSELSALTRVSGPLSIEQNLALMGLDGLGALDRVGTLSLLENPELASLSGANALTTVDDDVFVMGNPKLPTAEAESLAATISVGGEVVICGNAGGDPC